MSTDVSGRIRPAHTQPTESGTPVTVKVKPCCGILAGEACDCRQFAAEARGMFTSGNAIMCRPASEWNA